MVTKYELYKKNFEAKTGFLGNYKIEMFEKDIKVHTVWFNTYEAALEYFNIMANYENKSNTILLEDKIILEVENENEKLSR